MTFLRNRAKILTVAATCLAVGAGAGVIANAGAATSAKAGTHAKRAGLHPRRLLSRTVHADLVVATKAGFATVTFDRGFVQSVSGQQLTISEGTKKATYKTITLTIPATARVRDDGAKSTLGSLKSGQHVLVVQGPKRTFVIARTR
jgi:hypothetical protein